MIDHYHNITHLLGTTRPSTRLTWKRIQPSEGFTSSFILCFSWTDIKKSGTSRELMNNFTNCSSLVTSNSLAPVTISGMMHPNDHRSTAWPRLPRKHTSDARYGIAWIFVLYMVCASFTQNAQPKSMIFTWWLFPVPEQNIMLSGLRSACTIPITFKPAKPCGGEEHEYKINIHFSRSNHIIYNIHIIYNFLFCVLSCRVITRGRDCIYFHLWCRSCYHSCASDFV